MKTEIAVRLLEINHSFYTDFAAQFSATRGRIQPGVRRVLRILGGNESILDLGCGNGELALHLVRGGHLGAYVGLDFSLPLLKEARQAVSRGLPVMFAQADLTSSDWDRSRLPVVGNQTLMEVDYLTLNAERFEVVFAFAVLHHIPGTELRLSILKKVHGFLHIGGRFIHSEWQFLDSPRLRDRIQPWEMVGLSVQDVDEGDHLLDWRSGGRGMRYVHQFTVAELEALATASGFEIERTFYSDGRGGKLGVYQVWKRV